MCQPPPFIGNTKMAGRDLPGTRKKPPVKRLLTRQVEAARRVRARPGTVRQGCQGTGPSGDGAFRGQAREGVAVCPPRAGAACRARSKDGHDGSTRGGTEAVAQGTGRGGLAGRGVRGSLLCGQTGEGPVCLAQGTDRSCLDSATCSHPARVGRLSESSGHFSLKIQKDRVSCHTETSCLVAARACGEPALPATFPGSTPSWQATDWGSPDFASLVYLFDCLLISLQGSF